MRGAKADVPGRRASPLAGLCGYLKKECRSLLESLTGDVSGELRQVCLMLPQRFWRFQPMRQHAQQNRSCSRRGSKAVPH